MKMLNMGTFTLHCGVSFYETEFSSSINGKRGTGNPFLDIPMEQLSLTINNGVFLKHQRETGNGERETLFRISP